MRVCAVTLPELRIEIVRRELDAASAHLPLAVIVAPAPMTEAKLLGNTRLSVVSREARALGILPGHTIAQARARAGDLAVRVVRPNAVRDVLACLAEVGLAFGATVSFGMEGEEEPSAGTREGTKPRGNTPRARARSSYGDVVWSYGDVVWIDVTGCAHLHAPQSSIFDGETILASRLAGVIASLGHTCFVAIADGPCIAAMLARAASETALRAALGARRRTRSNPTSSGREKSLLPDIEPIVVRPGDNARAIAPLPVSSLPLEAEDVRWLAKIGIRTIEEMRALPRPGLATRLGARAREVLSLVDGEDRSPLASYVPPEVPEEVAALECGIEGTQALTFVAKTLTDRLSVRLQGRAVAAARVELELHLDAAMLSLSAARVTMLATANDNSRELSGRHEKISVEIVALDLPAPLSTASDLLAALRPKIERLVLGAPVLGAKLRAPVLVHKRAAALSLFDPQPKAERALPRLVAELVSDLGAEAVSSLVLGDSWVPEERSRLVAYSTMSKDMRSTKKRRRMLSSVPEPTRLLAEPRPIARDGVRITRHLSRVEAALWWKTMPSVRPVSGSSEESSSPQRRDAVDYVQAWTDDGAAWIEIDRTTGGMRVRGWFD
jgi:protein ImuB